MSADSSTRTGRGPAGAAAIVLAAGAGERMGGRPKALLELGGETFVARIVRSAHEGGVERVVVVRGKVDIGRVEGAEVVVNPTPERGMLSSIHAGLRLLIGGGPASERAPHAPSGVLVWPVDCPRAGPEVVRAILEAAGAGAPVVVPRSGGRRGHPTFFGAQTFAELLGAPPGVGARAVVAAHAAATVFVDLEAREVLDDIDTPEEYAKLRE